ncbi:MAG: hypothetical protein RLO17_13360 [Cyclobacteriaceae bacterium]
MRIEILLSVILVTACQALRSQDFVVLKIDQVIQDILSSPNIEFPDGKEEISERPIEIFYTNGYAIAHVQYRTGGAEASMKQSYALIYALNDNKWKKKEVVPFNYDIKILDKNHSLFLSENLFCNIDFQCTFYLEFTYFSEKDFTPIVSYTGYDNYPFCDALLSRNRLEELKKHQFDTITNVFRVKDYVITNEGLDSFRLEQETRILQDWDLEEGLVTWDTTQIIQVKVK